ncbi:hypothetical protein J4Q44_G00061550 [Coregonus suidteri]|uniref:Ig-like domain-containing protein n=1 Tax=Coregonus suidteri TaxID=861788 RepID=A0AAN8MDB5_9TELE
MYYCLAVHSQMVHTGNGSKVIILAERVREGNSAEAPTIQIVSSPEVDGFFIPLLCLVLEVGPVSDSNAMCTMLMYGTSAAALLTIIVAVTIAVCLHRGHPVFINADGRQRGTCTENRQDQSERVREGNSAEAPTIQIVSSPEVDGFFIPLLCLVLEVVPSQVRVFWLIDGREESGLTDSTWTNNSDSATEFTRNQILVQAEEWGQTSRVYMCGGV